MAEARGTNQSICESEQYSFVNKFQGIMDFNGLTLLELNNAEFIDKRFKRSFKASKLFYEIINYCICLF